MRDAYLKLALVEGFGEGLVPALLAPDLDPVRCLAAPPPLPPRAAARLRWPDLAARADRLAAAAAAAGLELLTPADAAWPERLRHAPLRPLVLFVRGDPAALARSRGVALVGTRTPTPYGSATATALATALAQAGATVWSGLARGVDALAHRASVATGTPTVAVLAGGLDAIYPPEHAALARAIADGGGCLVSELPPGQAARRGHFPRRNRLLALGVEAVVVVEASLASGARHTARFAAEASTDVFAVPGPWHSSLSQGCHRLIAEGAGIVEDPAALLQALGFGGRSTAAAALAVAASADEQRVLDALRDGPRPGDLVQREAGLERGPFLRALFGLERRGAVRRLAGDLLHALPAGPPGAVTSR
ncbi:MAG: DNA-protecting protein DprA [Planctomycetes bacterium]|nr:DNA-protecting protein DprA [Planctomycetota bacterium]